MNILRNENNKLIYHYDAETLWVEPWGIDAFRIRSTRAYKMPTDDGALLKQVTKNVEISITDEVGTIINGKIKVVVTVGGKLFVYNSNGTLLLEEYVRNRKDLLDEKCSAIEVEAREFKPILGGDYHITQRFESLDAQEKIYGMGQYQQPYLDLKGTDLELAHRNSQASVPFALSSRGYGFLWNNPAIGRAVFGKNIMSFEAYSSETLDYVVIAGDTPADILKSYSGITGYVPMMPEYGLGFWQCKLRYQSQDELLEVARAFKKRSLPIDVIVVDYFHWPKQGDWRFDETYWPNPKAMVEELKAMGIELMVSIWPTVDKQSENYEEMLREGYLTRTDRGVRVGLDFEGATIHYDTTNKEARQYVWQKAKQNYYDLGIKTFWLDEAEPEYSYYDFDIYRYAEGNNMRIGNLYPLYYAKTFYEGMTEEGQENIVNLLRCAWLGSQKYGALVWSGDIASSFDSMRNQLAAGLNMGLAGIPWWTTDIGGFHGGDPNDEGFRELFARWFAWGAFLPVMRLHGDREPKQPQQGNSGGATCLSGAPNEPWSYGDEVYEICKKYMNLRESMRDYTRTLMQEAHEEGAPVMRTMFYEFPDDPMCWTLEDQYMYGEKYLVAPVMEVGVVTREVYLPSGHQWTNIETNQCFDGGKRITVDAPIDVIPVFIKQ